MSESYYLDQLDKFSYMCEYYFIMDDPVRYVNNLGNCIITDLVVFHDSRFYTPDAFSRVLRNYGVFEKVPVQWWLQYLRTYKDYHLNIEFGPHLPREYDYSDDYEE